MSFQQENFAIRDYRVHRRSVNTITRLALFYAFCAGTVAGYLLAKIGG
jgi:hypothetical protein